LLYSNFHINRNLKDIGGTNYGSNDLYHPKLWLLPNGERIFSSKWHTITEYNVAADMRRAEEMVRKSGQMGVPVIDINGRIIVGFNKEEIERLLKR